MKKGKSNNQSSKPKEDVVNNLKTLAYDDLMLEFSRVSQGKTGLGFNADCKASVLSAIRAEAKSRLEFKTKDLDDAG